MAGVEQLILGVGDFSGAQVIRLGQRDGPLDFVTAAAAIATGRTEFDRRRKDAAHSVADTGLECFWHFREFGLGQGEQINREGLRKISIRGNGLRDCSESRLADLDQLGPCRQPDGGL